jgi:ABC-type branched-subunit amino acid transport system substrate-binding protein
VGPYGEDGQSPGWIFMGTNPTYSDQLGSICDYLIANSDRSPKPVMGFMDFGGSSEIPYPEARAYCESFGIRFAGASRFPEAATNIHPQVQKLIDAGVNIIYSQARLSGTALIARTLKEMGLQQKITLIGSHLVLDSETFTSSPLGLDENGIPFLNGLIGSMPTRSWSETDDPGIQLIIQQADLHQRPITVHTNSYIRAWIMTDLFIETYVQTGDRVGFDHVIGADIKATLENLVYAPLGGVEQVDFRNGRRALATNRIGQLKFLGQDGRTPAGLGNPPMVVTVGDQQLQVPMIIPLTDFQPVPDLRPSGADVPTAAP